MTFSTRLPPWDDDAELAKHPDMFIHHANADQMKIVRPNASKRVTEAQMGLLDPQIYLDHRQMNRLLELLKSDRDPFADLLSATEAPQRGVVDVLATSKDRLGDLRHVVDFNYLQQYAQQEDVDRDVKN